MVIPLYNKKTREILKDFFYSILYLLSKRSRLKDLHKIKKIHYLCYGNICRSAFSEHISNKIFSQRGIKVQVTSSGIAAYQENSPPENAIIAGKKFGIDLSGHIPKLLNKEFIDNDCIVLGMHYFHFIQFKKQFPSYTDKFYLLKDFAGDKQFFLNISDPYGKSIEEFTQCFFEIEMCIKRLADKLTAHNNIGGSLTRDQ